MTYSNNGGPKSFRDAKGAEKRAGYALAAMGALLLTFLLGVGAGVILDRVVLLGGDACPSVPDQARAHFELMGQAWRIINRRYVNHEAVIFDDMAHAAIAGMVTTLDDPGHTRFMTPEQAESHRQFAQGRFEGIGAFVDESDGQIVIVTAMENSPAEEAGLSPGDVILQVDGEAVSGLPLEEVISRVTGPAGTEVTLTIQDADTGDTRTLTLVRAPIELDLVTWARVNDTGLAHLRISSFSQGTGNALRQALNEIVAEGDIHGVILDLRNNPGGLLWEAVEATSSFIDEGVVVVRRDASGNVDRMSVRRGITATELETVVLINAGTASGAEIMTGALQDHARAVALGTTTAGAGTVLNEFELRDGSVLLLAVEEWRTPDNRVIWHRGLEPDIVVELPEDARPIYPRHINHFNADLEPADDPQLQRAIELLSNTP
jgi:carboxyl-terminal processing protease